MMSHRKKMSLNSSSVEGKNLLLVSFHDVIIRHYYSHLKAPQQKAPRTVDASDFINLLENLPSTEKNMNSDEFYNFFSLYLSLHAKKLAQQ